MNTAQISHSERKAAEELFAQCCRTANLGDRQRDILRLHLCGGMTTREIQAQLQDEEYLRAHVEKRRAKPLKAGQIQDLINGGLRRLVGVPGFREVLRRIVEPEQFRRVRLPDERPVTLTDLMRGPDTGERQTPMVGLTWTEMARLPGAPKKEGVPVQMAETVRRWW